MMDTRAAAATGCVLGPVLLSAALAASASVEAADERGRSATSHRFDLVRIAAPTDALTFARVDVEGRQRTIAVNRFEAGVVHGLDLSLLFERPIEDPISLFLAEGYDGILARITSAPGTPIVSVPADRLTIPVDLGEHHIAAGTNYPEHAGEADVTEGPFLFPKVVRPTAAQTQVSAGDGLLDYEAELAFVTLQPIERGGVPSAIGVILCNDYTDRATLLRNVDVHDVTSGKGFTTGKSFPGYLPVGNLFVIPRDVRAFAAAIELRLWVNDAERQRSMVSAAVWNIDELIARTWDRSDVTWDHRGQHVRLIDDPRIIPERTLILSGTPAGTVFQGVGVRDKIAGLRDWLFGGWAMPLPAHVIEAYIRQASRRRAYLQPRDRVVVHVDFVGVIVNEITR